MSTINSPPLDFQNFRQPWNSSPAYNETAETAVQDNCFYFFYAPTKVSFVFLNELLKKPHLKERQVLNCKNSFRAVGGSENLGVPVLIGWA